MEKVTTRVSEKRSMNTKGIARFSTWEHKQYSQQLDMALNITNTRLPVTYLSRSTISTKSTRQERRLIHATKPPSEGSSSPLALLEAPQWGCGGKHLPLPPPPLGLNPLAVLDYFQCEQESLQNKFCKCQHSIYIYKKTFLTLAKKPTLPFNNYIWIHRKPG